MRLKTTIAAIALILSGGAALAGGLSDEIMEAPVEVEEVMAPAASSISPAIIVVGLLAALLLASSLSNDDDTEPQ